ncbi:MBL fold metallo-hydrolase [Gemmatimonadota bacterium]
MESESPLPFEVILLGTGAALPPVGRENTSLALSWAGGIWLIDCGASPHRRLRAAGLDPADLRGITITHAHPDHLYGLPSLLHCLLSTPRNAALPVLAPPATLRKARLLLELFNLHDRPEVPLDLIEVPLEPARQGSDPVYEVDGLRLWFEPVEHGPEAIGVRAEAGGRAIACSGDSAPCAGIDRLARGANLLVHEATFLEGSRERDGADHSTAREAGSAARRAGVETLVLVHFLEATISDPGAVKREAGEVFTGTIIVGEDLGRYQV